MVNSYWWYNNSENEKKVSKVYKGRQINENEDEKRQNLPADYENDRYIPFFLLKVSNYPVNLDKRTRSLIHLVSIESKKYQMKY